MTELTTHSSGRQLTITRAFQAPKALVFDAFTMPEQLVKWWGPKGFTTTVTQMDVRPGGVWHYCMSSPEWGESWGIATYQEVTPPERLIYTDAFSDAAGITNPDLPVARSTVEFAARDGRTILTIVTDYATEDDLRKVLEMGMIEGMTSQFERLDELLAEAV